MHSYEPPGTRRAPGGPSSEELPGVLKLRLMNEQSRIPFQSREPVRDYSGGLNPGDDFHHVMRNILNLAGSPQHRSLAGGLSEA
jgi:hypothetical protein